MRAGDAGEAVALAPPGSCVAMEASVGGLPSDALRAIDDVGAIDRLDASSLAVRVSLCLFALQSCMPSALPSSAQSWSPRPQLASRLPGWLAGSSQTAHCDRSLP